jgi:hypothetical protein
MTAKTSLPVPASAEEYLAAAHPGVLRAMLKMFADQLMPAEADAVCGAEYGQVSDDRTNRRIGYRRDRSRAQSLLVDHRRLGVVEMTRNPLLRVRHPEIAAQGAGVAGLVVARAGRWRLSVV